MEFKGKQRAEEYASKKSSSPVFKENHIKDYLSGYNQALKDSKAPEMLQELQETLKDLLCIQGSIYDSSRIDARWEGAYDIIQKQIDRKKQLIKQATEL